MHTAVSESESASPVLPLALRGHGKQIHQVTPTFDIRDAISDEALLIRDSLRVAGFGSDIFSPMIAPVAASNVLPFDKAKLAGADLVIYHFGIASDSAEEVSRLRQRRTLWYHNVTPSKYYRPYTPIMAELLDAGRQQLQRIAARFDSLIADSKYNASELNDITPGRVDVVPFPIDFRRFGGVPSSKYTKDTAVRWLSVGRIAPSKGLLRLVRAFASYCRRQPDSQLVLAGVFRSSDAFYLRLLFEIERLQVEDKVLITGSLADDELHSLFLHTDLYVTMSEHEGFCVPIVEAMFFDLPIIATTAAAIPETLGEAAILVAANASSEDVAALADVVLSDDSIRGRLLQAQRVRREAFVPAQTSQAISKAIENALTTRGTANGGKF